MSSASILLSALGTYGDIYPVIGLALELKKRGHQPTLALPGCFENLVDRNQFEFIALTADYDAFGGRNVAIGKIGHPETGAPFLWENMILPNLQSDFEALGQGKKFKLVVTHGSAVAAQVFAQVNRIPWSSVALAPSAMHSKFQAPAWPGVLGGLNLFGGFDKAWESARNLTSGYLESIKTFCWNVGLPVDDDHDFFTRQHSSQLHLGLFSRTLVEPKEDWPKNSLIAGFPRAADAGNTDSETLQWLAKGDPAVVFTMGSSALHSPNHFFKQAIDFARRTGLRSIIAAGPNCDDWNEWLPDHIRAVASINLESVFEFSRVVVHHGGIGTTAETMRAGLPMVVIPGDYAEADLASRLSALELAIEIPRSGLTEYALEEAVMKILTTPEYDALAKLAVSQMRYESGTQVAADALECLAFGAELESRLPSDVPHVHPQIIKQMFEDQAA